MDGKANTLHIGSRGEDLACRHLKDLGYHIRERNYRFGRGEVDIICQHGDILVFVEVKTRKNSTYGFPESFVDDKKTQLFHLVAEHYILTEGWDRDVRFDIIAITLNPEDLRHFEDAFH